ncbi:MAG: type II toxin-antitoxin system prevent-host-death family antitoxin [Patescibacteria group bacterium]
MSIKQKTVGLKELRENTEKYISEVEKGKSFTVLRRSKPLFVIAPVDEQESLWETVVDFTTIDKRGVSADAVLKSLRSLA